MSSAVNTNPFNLKTFITGIILCGIIGAGEPFGVMRLRGSALAVDYSTGAAVFLFFILVFAVNSILRKLTPRISFTSQQLVIIYMMMAVACAIPSWGFTMNFLFLISGVRYYATPANEWTKLIHPHIPSWLTPRDPEAVRTFWEGLPKGEHIPWEAWIGPIAGWAFFILTVYFTMICLVTIFRKQWVDNERLLFPLIEAPLQMAKQEQGSAIAPFFRNKLTWVGFSIPLIINSLIALHAYFPFVPAINLSAHIPFQSGALSLPVRLSFPLIGFAYLLTTEISLSLWFFCLLGWLETGIFQRIGFSLGARDIYCAIRPSIAYQSMGAFLVFVASAIWLARPHLRNVFRKAFKGDRDVDDRDEPLSYRAAVFGSIIGIFLIGVWLKLTGFSLPGILIFLFVVIAIFIGLTKIVCQAGVAYMNHPVSAGVFAINTLGPSGIGPGGATAVSFTFPWAGDLRILLMASFANGLKLLSAFKVKGRLIFVFAILAILAGLVSSILAVICIGYKYGGINCASWQAQGMASHTFNWARELMLHPEKVVDARRFLFLGIGAVVMTALTMARMRFLAWPLHPIGFAVPLSTPFYFMWFSIFLAWLPKVLILKYGGPKAYKSSLPFFLGMIMGAFVSAGIWNIIAFFTGMTDIHLTVM